MYNLALLYRKTALTTGISDRDTKAAVEHYYRAIRNALRGCEQPAFYIDYIGTISVNLVKLEQHLRKIAAIYANAKKHFYNNPVRNERIILSMCEEFGRLNRIRHDIKAHYSKKLAKREERSLTQGLGTRAGYCGSTAQHSMAQANP